MGLIVKTSHGKRDQGLTQGSPAGLTRLEALKGNQLPLLTLLWVIIWWEKLSGVMEGKAQMSPIIESIVHCD